MWQNVMCIYKFIKYSKRYGKHHEVNYPNIWTKYVVNTFNKKLRFECTEYMYNCGGALVHSFY